MWWNHGRAVKHFNLNFEATELLGFAFLRPWPWSFKVGCILFGMGIFLPAIQPVFHVNVHLFYDSTELWMNRQGRLLSLRIRNVFLILR